MIMFKKASLLALVFSGLVTTAAFAAPQAPAPQAAPNAQEQVHKNVAHKADGQKVKKGDHKAVANKGQTKANKPAKPSKDGQKKVKGEKPTTKPAQPAPQPK